MRRVGKIARSDGPTECGPCAILPTRVAVRPAACAKARARPIVWPCCRRAFAHPTDRRLGAYRNIGARRWIRTSLSAASARRNHQICQPGGLVRAPVIETGSPEWRSGAGPSSYVRVDHRPAVIGRLVMAGLVPAIHALPAARQTWMPGTRPGMTTVRHDSRCWSSRQESNLRWSRLRTAALFR